MGILDKLGFDKLKHGLSKTREGLFGSVTRLVTSKNTIDDEVIEQLEETLISADVGVEATMEIIEAIKKRIKEDRYADVQELQHLLRDEIQRQFVETNSELADPFIITGQKPHVIMVIGVNGVGKTTTIGKLAHHFAQRGMKVTLGAADTFRAAANEQLGIWAQRADVHLIRHAKDGDPAAVAFDAVQSASARGDDVVIIDTAGRLHTRVNLMEELKKIKRVIQKQNPDAPHETLLILDATTGQNGITQAREFGAAVGVTGLVITKLDGTAKGGIALSIIRTLNIPVRFIGIGEQLDDLQPFSRKEFVDALFDETTS
jgi:fused signal recognition particle receptor